MLLFLFGVFFFVVLVLFVTFYDDLATELSTLYFFGYHQRLPFLPSEFKQFMHWRIRFSNILVVCYDNILNILIHVLLVY